MRRALIVFAASMVLAATLAAPADAAATREEYALQADPICKRTDKHNNRHWKRFLRLNKQSKSKGAINELRGIGVGFDSSNRELRLIVPPPGDEALISEWIGIWDRVARRWQFAARGYKLKLWSEVDNQLNRIDQLAKEARGVVSGFPFQACA